ncbi:hypothetical protein BST61_g239 [Cercospora zeina]
MKHAYQNSAQSAPSILRWRAPIVMLSSLFVGVAFAVGHHVFYASLEGTSVSSNPIKLVGWTTTQQQVNIAIGTALAFAFKASLILACSTAYMQLVFDAINKETFKLSHLDNWFGGLNDFWSFLCVGSYWRYPLLTLVALTCWLLPLAAIISPASLSVVFDRINPSPSRNALPPQPAFDSLEMGTYFFSQMDAGMYISYAGPTKEVNRIAVAAATQGTILPIDPPGTNATWQSIMVAPRLDCGDIDRYTKQDIRDNLIDFFKNATNDGDWAAWTNIMFDYLAWSAASNDLLPTPFKNDIDNGWTLKDFSESGPKMSYRLGTGVDMFFAVLPRVTEDSRPPELRGPLPVGIIAKNTTANDEGQKLLMDWYLGDSTMLHCRAVQTKYTLNFTYDGPDQAQRVRVIDMQDAVAIDFNSTAVYANGPEYTYTSKDPSTATVVAGAPVRATRSSSLPARFSTAIATPTIAARSAPIDRPLRLKGQDEMDIDVSNITESARHSLRLASWAAIQEATMSLFLGASRTDYLSPGRAFISVGLGGLQSSRYFQTQAFSTVLAKTRELSQLSSKTLTAEQITNVSSGVAFDQAASLLPNVSTNGTRLMKDVLEEIFLNITISMASNKAHLYHADSPLAPPPVWITEVLYGNVYSYALDKLWLAYGIAIGISVLNVMVGFFAIFQNRASFTDNFSTIVRIARNATIEADMHEEDLPGKDALQNHIAEAELRLLKHNPLLDSKQHGRVTIIERRPSSDLDS